MSSQSHAHSLFGDLSIDIHDMSVQETISGMSDAEVDPALLGDIAYMLYTSGTRFFNAHVFGNLTQVCRYDWKSQRLSHDSQRSLRGNQSPQFLRCQR
jgi:hypothetical protein